MPGVRDSNQRDGHPRLALRGSGQSSEPSWPTHGAQPSCGCESQGATRLDFLRPGFRLNFDFSVHSPFALENQLLIGSELRENQSFRPRSTSSLLPKRIPVYLLMGFKVNLIPFVSIMSTQYMAAE